MQSRAQPGDERDILERTYFDETKAKSSFGDKTNFKSSSSAYEQYFSLVPVPQFMRDGQCGNDVPTGASTSNKNAQI